MIRPILSFFEKKAYGVCTALGDHMGIRPHRVRLWFIYLSFLTFGSPLFVYLVLMFWRQNRHIFTFSKGRKSIWE